MAHSLNVSWVPDSLLGEFVNQCIDSICYGRPVPREPYAECPLDVFCSSTHGMKNLIRKVCCNEVKEEECASCFHNFTEAQAGCVYHTINGRLKEVKNSLIHEMLMNTSHLSDIDWNVKLAVSSSKMLNLNVPLLTLVLHTSSENTMENYTFQLTSEEVGILLEKLRAAQREMVQYHVTTKN